MIRVEPWRGRWMATYVTDEPVVMAAVASCPLLAVAELCGEERRWREHLQARETGNVKLIDANSFEANQ